MTYPEILTEAWKLHLAPRTPDAPTVISLFAGCGGSSLGYSMAGFRELLAVEWDENAAATFRLNFPDVPVYQGDIAGLTSEAAMQLAGIRPGELDVLDGSPPCQGFSTAGKRDMNDSRNQLFREYVRLLRDLQPRAFVMENVSGMVKGKMKLVFVEILKELKACGYRVSARLMNAMYFEVPQSRARMIFIGMRDGEPTHPAAKQATISAGNAIEGTVNVTFNRPLAKTARAIWNYVKPGQNGSHYRTNYYMNSVKIAPGRPSPTIAKVVSGTGGHLHWQECRSLTIEELKRLASFPDTVSFTGKFDRQWALIGNSVPPLFMRAIASHIREHML